MIIEFSSPLKDLASIL